MITIRDFESGADKTQGPLRVLVRTLRNLGDARLITWLLIMSCFWLMMYSLWDLQPNFVTDWNNSGDVAGWLNIVPGLEEQHVPRLQALDPRAGCACGPGGGGGACVRTSMRPIVTSMVGAGGGMRSTR